MSNVIPMDCNIPTAIRKEIWEYSQLSIEKYLSFDRLSDGNRAFVSRLSNMFVPITIKEVLDDPSWKFVVIKAKNALE